jgi:hypothetical protein
MKNLYTLVFCLAVHSFAYAQDGLFTKLDPTGQNIEIGSRVNAIDTEYNPFLFDKDIELNIYSSSTFGQMNGYTGNYYVPISSFLALDKYGTYKLININKVDSIRANNSTFIPITYNGNDILGKKVAAYSSLRVVEVYDGKELKGKASNGYTEGKSNSYKIIPKVLLYDIETAKHYDLDRRFTSLLSLMKTQDRDCAQRIIVKNKLKGHKIEDILVLIEKLSECNKY